MTTFLERLGDTYTPEAYKAEMQVWDAGLLKITGLDDDRLLQSDDALMEIVAAHLRRAPDSESQYRQLMMFVGLERGQIEHRRQVNDRWPTLNDDIVLGAISEYLATAENPTDARRMLRATLAEEQELWREQALPA